MVAAVIQWIYNHQVDIPQYADSPDVFVLDPLE